MYEKENLQQNNSMIGGYNMAKTSFAGTENNSVKEKNELIKPITFSNPNSSGQVRFFTDNGREKPFVQGTSGRAESYTIIGEHGKVKPVYIPNTYTDALDKELQASKDVKVIPPVSKPEKTTTVYKTDTQKPLAFTGQSGLNAAPNITFEAALKENPVIQSYMQTPDMYNFPWCQEWMWYGNHNNDVSAVSMQNIDTQNMTDPEPQSQIEKRQNYTDQILRVQQLQQPLTVINGIAPIDNATEISVVNQPKQAPGKQTYKRAEVQFTNDGHWQIAVLYSDSQKCAVMKQIWGNYQIFKLEYENTPSKDRKFQIIFESGITVLGKQKGLTEDSLYRYFIGAGVDLKDEKMAELPEKAVKEALYVFFKKQIESARKIIVDGRAGWQKEIWNWLCAENNLYTDREVVPNLPIMNKLFWTKNFEEIDCNWLKIFEFYKEIPDESYRVLFMEMLVGGVLSSKLNEAKTSIKFFLNLVLTEGMQIEPFCKLFQVFNRDRIECYELSGKEKPEDYLKRTKDQVMILHTTSGASDYKLRQGCERLNQIVDAVCYGAGHGSVVVINSERTDREEGINILLDSSFITERMSELLKQDVVGDFLQKFILWVMNRGYGQPQVENILHTVTCNSSVLDKVRQILEAFCKSQGLDLYEMLGTSEEAAREINADPLCMENELSVSDIVETIRTEIRVFQMAKRSNGKYADDTCYYDTETIWVPVTIMERIFELGEVHDKVGVLKALKQEKVLLGKNKLTTTITTVDEKKLECYRLKLSALNSRGKVELASLGKETK